MKPTPSEFDAIRSYEDADLKGVLDELFADEQFVGVLRAVYKNVPLEQLKAELYACNGILDFQKKFIYTLVRHVLALTRTHLTFDGEAIKGGAWPCTFISNHRDIVLDSAFLSFLLVENGFPDTVQIAIGDNLLIFPWIKRVVRLNKAFIVQRGLGLRETLLASQQLSRYMHFVISEKGEPIWIAQREGRAKDSDDRTQASVLKMIAMGGAGTPIESLREMNIVPLTISYEFDPCDFLKAREFQLKRDNADYHKTKRDDMLNMQTGIYGYKGRVHYHAAPCINAWLDDVADLPKAQAFDEVARRMDEDLFRGYRLYPGNYIAADLLAGTRDHAANYAAADEERFEKYLAGQLAKIQLPQKDEPFLRECMLKMYANPLLNYERAQHA